MRLLPPPLAAAAPVVGLQMVLSGEGSDEVFGGYLYFHKAPNKVTHTPGPEGRRGGGGGS